VAPWWHYCVVAIPSYPTYLPTYRHPVGSASSVSIQ